MRLFWRWYYETVSGIAVQSALWWLFPLIPMGSMSDMIAGRGMRVPRPIYLVWLFVLRTRIQRRELQIMTWRITHDWKPYDPS